MEADKAIASCRASSALLLGAGTAAALPAAATNVLLPF